MAVNINVPSQVRTFANLAAFPASGAVKTIYIAEDTNKTYRWTGSVYVEISASAATGLTIGTTPIASGTTGRVLFEGTGNVLQESANLFWDNTNNRLGIGTSIPISPIHILSPIGQQSTITLRTLDNTTSGGYTGINCFDNLDNLAFSFAYGNSGSLLPNSAIIGTRTATGVMSFVTGPSATVRATLFSTGNFAINTTTDAGFKLDVNGTARVAGVLTAQQLFITGSTGAGHAFSRLNDNGALLRIFNWSYGNSSGNTWVNGSEVASSLFALNSTTKGFLPPRMTTTERNAIASPAAGLVVFDSTLNKLCVYTTAWETVTSL
jgi:hypothetical protein